MENKGTAFLVGAGFSKAVSLSTPVTFQLADPLKHYVSQKDQRLFDLIPSGHWENIEYLFGVLAEALPWRNEAQNLELRAGFLKMSEYFRAAIAANQRNAFKEIEIAGEEHWARKFIKFCLCRNVAILSLNYDLLVEKLISIERNKSIEYRYHYPIPPTLAITRDGTSVWGEGIPRTSLFLYKLHGSLNWYYSGNPSIPNDQIFDCGLEYATRDLVSVLSETERAIYRNMADKYPFIVPPVLSKQLLLVNETVKANWRGAFDYLKDTDKVFVVGYSFPTNDTMMGYFFREAVSRIPFLKIWVVDPKREPVKRLKEILFGLDNFEILEDLIGDDCIEKMMNKLVEVGGEPVDLST